MYFLYVGIGIICLFALISILALGLQKGRRWGGGITKTQTTFPFENEAEHITARINALSIIHERNQTLLKDIGISEKVRKLFKEENKVIKNQLNELKDRKRSLKQ